MMIMCFPSFFPFSIHPSYDCLTSLSLSSYHFTTSFWKKCMVSACLKITLLCLFCCSALGENFDRQASLRRSLIYTDTLVRRPKKVKRRKTITGVLDNIQKELGMAHQNCILLPLTAAQHYYANLICAAYDINTF